MQIGKQIVVSTVDQQIQNGQSPEFLTHLLKNPLSANANRQQLEILVQTHPQCSVFRMLLAKATQNSDSATAAQNLHLAALHAANREVLFRLIHQTEQFLAPQKNRIYQKYQPPLVIETIKSDASFIEEKTVDIDEVPAIETAQPEIVDASFIEEKSDNIEETPFVETAQPEIADASFTGEKTLEEEIVAENDLRVEDVNLHFVNEPAEEIIFPETETIQQPVAINSNATIIDDYFSVIDEEVYDEITAIEDIDFEVVKTASPEKTNFKAEPEKEEQSAFSVQDKAEKEMLSRIASIDYFTFNNRFGQKQNEVSEPIVEQKTEVAAAKTEDLSPEKEPETVSKYHDDKMPYTFMWWLDKTRKEYAGTYQPYVKLPQIQQNKSRLSVGPELHQQYIESIFHAKQPIGLEETNLPAPTEQLVKRKEDQLIERFIIEEPHIHPPSADRLDTENKAKKSSEDGDILVTETLAKIYFDQMLYHKALDTYQKLVLKFPEKSRYFTSQIELIEKKIN